MSPTSNSEVVILHTNLGLSLLRALLNVSLVAFGGGERDAEVDELVVGVARIGWVDRLGEFAKQAPDLLPSSAEVMLRLTSSMW